VSVAAARKRLYRAGQEFRRHYGDDDRDGAAGDL
jgi:hypothetical protein